MTKFRNKMIALLCLAGFAGLGVLYFKNWVVQKPFAVILFVGDGLVGSKLAAARLYRDGATRRLFLESFPHVALLNNHGADFAVPEAASAATLIATGQRGSQRAISLRQGEEPFRSLLRIAQERGRATGLVTNGRITSPTLAAFYSHAASASERDSIALQLLESDTPDVVMGGGRSDFLPTSKGGNRQDGRDLILEFQNTGRKLPRNKNELESIPEYQYPELLAIFSEAELPYSDTIAAENPTLSDMVRRAIRLLQYNRTGYFLVVDADLIARASSQNDGEQTLREIVELDRAIETAVRYAGENAVILATAKHSTGGMVMNGYPLLQERGMALIGRNPQGIPSITWSTGPGGAGDQALEGRLREEPVAASRNTAADTVEDVIAIGMGPGAERLQGFQDASLVFDILKNEM